ncbi:MAG: hypothetical protein MUF34_32130 [Polyangiaceae bacterium]|nr:hypothetical protein [Polyangiaceae bacterium]
MLSLSGDDDDRGAAGRGRARQGAAGGALAQALADPTAAPPLWFRAVVSFGKRVAPRKFDSPRINAFRLQPAARPT